MTQVPIDGLRADAEPTADLPTRIYGGLLPARCQYCGAGSANMSTEPPLGQHQRGMVTCMLCSRQVCWLAAPLRAVPQPSRLEPSRAHAPHDGIRTKGCGETCTTWDGHDPFVHEQYGRQRALAERVRVPTGPAATGPLVVDISARRVWVEGSELVLSRTEMAILVYLASHLGQVCPAADIVAYAWDGETAEVWGQRSGQGRFHTMHTVLSRLRARLGPARYLLETRLGLGVVLLAEDLIPFDIVSKPIAPQVWEGSPWSRMWPACRQCDTTRKPHHGHGLCTSCRQYRKLPRPTKGATP